MISIYHINDYKKYLEYNFVDEYKLVATVRGTDLEKAYRLTQNLEELWINNKNVKVIPRQLYYRSSSIGDIFELNGIYYRVAMCGFEQIEKPIKKY